MKSIRLFLIAVILATITLFNFIAALQGYRSSLLEAERLFDNQMMETAEFIADLYSENLLAPVDHAGNRVFQVWKNGELKAYSANAPIMAIAPLLPGFNFSNFDGYRWRTVARYDNQKQLWVLVAERTDRRYSLSENLILESFIPILMGLPVVGLLIWFIVSQGLKPLRTLADELGKKQPDDLSPLCFDAPKQELEQIVYSTNLLMGRLESSLNREKQFASDAAHELRTPISVLKVQLYNIAQLLPDEDSNLPELTETVDRLEHLVEQILVLYRTTPDQYSANFTRIDMGILTEEVLAQEYAQFEDKNQTLEFRGKPYVLSGDRFAITTLLQNLLSNASKYTPCGGHINVKVCDEQGDIVLTVEDSGPGIPLDEYQSVFERFYRSRGDRHNSGESGCGLGLAIVKHIVELHRAEITIAPSSFESGTAFRIRFPKQKTSMDT